MMEVVTMQDNKDTKPGIFKNQRFLIKFSLCMFLVIICSIIIFFIILRSENIFNLFGKIAKILEPIIMGLIFAYLLNPAVKFFYKKISFVLPDKYNDNKKAQKFANSLSITFTMIIVILIFYILGNMIIPEVYNSLYGLAISLPDQLDEFTVRIHELTQADNEIAAILETVITKGTEYVQNWIQNDILPQLNSLISSLTSGVIGFVKSLLNVIVGFIVSVYVLSSKDSFCGQTKKIIYAIIKPDYANIFLTTVRKSNEIFIGFISGKIIDSIIIGLLCFIAMTVLGLPYPLLISLIVGVTNVIPFFGPFIGAIPSIILILLTSPIQALYFAILVLVLQQLDGNIIGPKILGDSTGLSAFWVIFSILIGGGLFGFAGMLMGVPTFAVIYYVVGLLINHLLKKKGLDTQTSNYVNVKSISPDGNVEYLDDETKSSDDDSDSDDNSKIYPL